MSTKKITALTELSAAAAATDMLPVVDISDTTDAASGTTKKITATNICKGVGIGAGNTTTEPVKINTSTGNVGLGTSAPGTWLASGGASAKYLDMYVSSQPSVLSLVSQRDADTQVAGIVSFVNDANADASNNDADGKIIADILSKIVTSDSNDGDDSGGVLEFRTKPEAGSLASRMRIDSTGNMLLGGTATPTSSVGNLCLFNGTAPAASVTNGVVLYAQDVSTSELRVRDEAGNVTTLSPHNFDLLGERSDPMAWAYYAKNVFVGKEIAVDMMKVIRALEKLTGETYIKIKDLKKSEILDWNTEEEKKKSERKTEIDKAKSVGDAEPAAYTKKSKPSWIS
jgi:hypothetical protein